ncbi:NADPH-dependent F420 reductase [Chitinophagaceae bacterium LB-8]|uniref:NADPH-dependent F420 reductase n=1 Tax=Paraflavisolibacter caeni TaxID=2982496 RepID=A0A9X2Y172_9BACT|nr:NADPH-dependent F420 reductase [Paraflavisolibacter caeni]MCU7552871.1 NADPH-dependent F420 reductase [Paraflavisolibacter caeni]
MKIGVIGTGAIGGTIAKKMAVAGHEVKVYNAEGPDSLKKRAQELGVSPSVIDEIVNDVDVVILSIPTKAISDLPKDLFADVSENVILVDTSNYYPFRDGEIEELKNGKVESVWVAETLGRPVIKAFNNLLAHSLEFGGKPEGTEGRIAMAVSGDDDKAKKIIANLINDAGFDIVDAGSLSESWRHQPGTPAYCTELNAAELKQAFNDGIKEKAPGLRDAAITKLMRYTSQPSHEEILELNRSLFPKNPKGF